MNKRSIVFKRLLSCFLILAMAVAGLTVSPSEKKVYALDGDSGGTLTGGGVGTGGVSTGTPSVNDAHDAGYRIYIVPRSLINKDTKQLVSDTKTCLNYYKDFAIYEFFGGTYGSSYLGNRKTVSLKYTCDKQWNKTFQDDVNSSATASNSPDFSNLFAGTGINTGACPKFDYNQTIDWSAISNWADSTIKQLSGDNLDKFLDNYRSILRSNGADISPTASIDFYRSLSTMTSANFGDADDDYAIVFEPVICFSFANMANAPLLAVGYNDYDIYTACIGTHFSTSTFNKWINKLQGFYPLIEGQRPADWCGFSIYYGINKDAYSKGTLGTNYSVFYNADIKGNVYKEGSNIVTKHSTTLSTDVKMPRPWEVSIRGADISNAFKVCNSVTANSWGTSLMSDLSNKTLGQDIVTKLSNTNSTDWNSYNLDSYSSAYVALSQGVKSLDDLYKLNNVSLTASTQKTSLDSDSDIKAGNKYSMNYYLGKNMILSPSANEDNIETLVNSLMKIKDEIIVTKIYNTDKSEDVERIIGNASLFASSIGEQFNINLNKRTTCEDGYKGTQGLSIEFLTKKTYVNTDIASARLSYNSSNMDNNGVVQLQIDGSKAVSSNKYLVQSSITSTLNSSNTYIGDTNSTDSTYIIYYPKYAAGSYSLTNDKSGANLVKAITDKLNTSSSKTDLGTNIGNFTYGRTGEEVLKRAISSLGISDATIIYAGSGKKVSKTVSFGSASDKNGNLTGYDCLVLSIDDKSVTNLSNETIKSYELGHYCNTLLGDTSSINSLFNIRSSGGKVSVFKASDYSGAMINMNKSLTNKNIFEYKFGNNLRVFGEESANPKYIDYATLTSSNAYANHSTLLTRNLFVNDIVASSLSATNNAYKDYISTNLGLNLGVSGKTTSSDLGEITDNKVTKLKNSLKDVFSWTISKGGFGIVVNGAVHTQSIARYIIKEYCEVYRTADRATSSNTAKLSDIVKAESNDLTYKSSNVSVSDSTLKFYPEVGMLSYYTPNKATIFSKTEVSPLKLYVMGEKERSVKPSSLYLLSVNKPNAGVNATGDFKSTTVGTGTEATNLSKSMNNLPVVYAGGNISLASQGKFDISCTGFALDEIDKSVDGGNKIISSSGDSYNSIIADGSDVKSIWNSGLNYKPLEDYTKWVDEVKAKLGVDVSLKTTTKTGNEVKTYNAFNVANGSIKGGDTTSTNVYNIQVKNGAIVEDVAYTSLINEIAKKYYNVETPSSEQLKSAKSIFNNSGIAESIYKAIQTSMDSDNNSDSYSGLGNGNHWYDETVRTFVVREYVTTGMQLANIGLSDKIDMSAGPSQSTTSNSKFQNGYYGKWYMTVYLKKPLSNMDNVAVYNPSNTSSLPSAIDSGTVLVNNLYINNGDFIISDSTTADMNSNR